MLRSLSSIVKQTQNLYVDSLLLPACTCRYSTASASTPQPRPPYNILFLGSDDFSCASLDDLQDAGSELIKQMTVVVPPDAKTGRRLKGDADRPLRRRAQELNLDTITLPSSGLQNWIPPLPFHQKSLSNLLITASFGHLIPNSLLDLFPPLNALNVHPSMLPKYRGAAPIQWAVINGDAETGVSVQELSRGKFDHGRLLGQRTVKSTYHDLQPRLAKEGGALLVEILRNLAASQENAISQSEIGIEPSAAHKLTKEHARIRWAEFGAEKILSLQRGISHQYPLWTTPPHQPELPIQLLIADQALPSMPVSQHSAPGSLSYDKPSGTLWVRCANASVQIDKLKSSGGRWTEAKDWWNGRPKGLLSFKE